MKDRAQKSPRAEWKPGGERETVQTNVLAQEYYNLL